MYWSVFLVISFSENHSSHGLSFVDLVALVTALSGGGGGGGFDGSNSVYIGPSPKEREKED